MLNEMKSAERSVAVLSESANGRPAAAKSRFSFGKKIIVGAVVLIAIVVTAFLFVKSKKKNSRGYEIYPQSGSISVDFRETGDVQPRNRLEIKPQVSGRIENVLVVEGQKIKKGEILAWMSSTDRAALLDAARSQSEAEVKKWEDAYKPTPIIAPLDGFIIVRNKEPGQTVTINDPIVVMADKLIVVANIDETDLRYIKLGQYVKIFLDAYPDKSFDGVVEHIAYESTVTNNVTVYEVKIRAENPPQNFRSGMTATIEVEADKKDNVLLLPADAIISNNGEKYILVKTAKGRKPSRRKVITGINNGKNVEIVSGVTEDDAVIVSGKNLSAAGASQRRGAGGIGAIFGQRGRSR